MTMTSMPPAATTSMPPAATAEPATGAARDLPGTPAAPETAAPATGAHPNASVCDFATLLENAGVALIQHGETAPAATRQAPAPSTAHPPIDGDGSDPAKAGRAIGREKRPAGARPPAAGEAKRPALPATASPVAVATVSAQLAPQAGAPANRRVESATPTATEPSAPPSGGAAARIVPLAASAGVATSSAGLQQPAAGPPADLGAAADIAPAPDGSRPSAAKATRPPTPQPHSSGPALRSGGSGSSSPISGSSRSTYKDSGAEHQEIKVASQPSSDRPSHDRRADAAAPAPAPDTPASSPVSSLTTTATAPAVTTDLIASPQAGSSQPSAGLTPASTAALQHAVRVVASTAGASPTVSHVVLRLDPPGIGTIALRLASHGGAVTVAIRTDTADAASAVAATRDQVLQALTGHGLSLGDVRVSSGATDTSGSGQPGGFGHSPADLSGGSGAGGSGAGGSGSGGSPDAHSRVFDAQPFDDAPSADRAQPTNHPAAASRPRREGTWL